ncbi:unnamed protein product [Pleuronectes platessa]|uniref:C-type lectin domain-containing protein n=1 Tax=Pleuronectes platessa TaxID=8262 RepID=A0A9N7UAX8_PLEPL|nr:unnamed protein product [Pleuronectes platessa]
MNSVCIQSTDVAPTESTKFPGVCPEESVQYHQSFSWLPFRGYCYLFVTEESEWANAASSCVRHGGVLASIEDPSEQQFLKSNVEIFLDSHSSFWIGLYKTHKGTWLWLDKPSWTTPTGLKLSPIRNLEVSEPQVGLGDQVADGMIDS